MKFVLKIATFGKLQTVVGKFEFSRKVVTL
jgi:hypothetical protein